MGVVIEKDGVLPIPLDILDSTGLKVGDVLVVEDAEPGRIRFRLASDEDTGEPFGRLPIEPLGTPAKAEPE